MISKPEENSTRKNFLGQFNIKVRILNNIKKLNAEIYKKNNPL